jgi:hypothetical protein
LKALAGSTSLRKEGKRPWSFDRKRRTARRHCCLVRQLSQPGRGPGPATIESGHVVNEAQAGACTFARLACGPAQCGPAGWDSYETQLTRAIMRVTNPFTVPVKVNARYVVVTMANDCLHSDAAGIPQLQTVPCSYQQLDEVASRRFRRVNVRCLPD